MSKTDLLKIMKSEKFSTKVVVTVIETKITNNIYTTIENLWSKYILLIQSNYSVIFEALFQKFVHQHMTAMK